MAAGELAASARTVHDAIVVSLDVVTERNKRGTSSVVPSTVTAGTEASAYVTVNNAWTGAPLR